MRSDQWEGAMSEAEQDVPIDRRGSGRLVYDKVARMIRHESEITVSDHTPASPPGEALPERLARAACMEGLGHQHIGVERAVGAAIRAALDAAAVVARTGVAELRERSVRYEDDGSVAMSLIIDARADERCEVAAAIEALKG